MGKEYIKRVIQWPQRIRAAADRREPVQGISGRKCRINISSGHTFAENAI
jgi:hypothetical protein